MPKSDFVPKYCLHKPSGLAYVRIRGKVIYLGTYGSDTSKREYGRLIAEFAANPKTTSSKSDSITIVELIDAYWEFAQGYYQKHGQPTRHLHTIRLALRRLKELYATTPANEFGPLAIRSIQGQMVKTGVSRRYINDQIDSIKRVFKWGVSVELIPPSIYQAIATVPGLKRGRTAARETEPIKPVQDEVVEATIPYLPPVVVDMVRFQRLTGCRPGEVFLVRPCDIDRSGLVWEYRPESHKTEHYGRQRVIYIGPKAQDVLRSYLLRDAENHCFSPAESEQRRHEEMRAKRKTRVQPSQRNRRKARPKRRPATSYNKDSYNRAIRRGIEKANKARTEEASDMGIEPMLLPHWHANQLRHTKATEIRKMFGLEAAQVILGHAKADVTQVYAERDETLAVEVSRKIG